MTPEEAAKDAAVDAAKGMVKYTADRRPHLKESESLLALFLMSKVLVNFWSSKEGAATDKSIVIPAHSVFLLEGI